MSESLRGLPPVSAPLCGQRGWGPWPGCAVDGLEALRAEAGTLSCKGGGLVSHQGSDICFSWLFFLALSLGRKNEETWRRQGDITLTQALGRQSHSERAGSMMGNP